MREIKFRAWDNKREEMLSFNLFYLSTQENIVVAYREHLLDNEGFVIRAKEDKLILMQYTGLKDTKNQEIYEGDIYQWIGGKREVVKWDNALAGWQPIDGASVGEVVGNIHENPELLEKQ